MLVTYFSILGSWMTTCLGKSCSFGLPCMPFVNCCQFMYLVISLLVLRTGYGIWLYLFLIFAYLFTFQVCMVRKWTLSLGIIFINCCMYPYVTTWTYSFVSQENVNSYRDHWGLRASRTTFTFVHVGIRALIWIILIHANICRLVTREQNCFCTKVCE